ncbi:uncharacterized protein LOC131322482 isoform X2 [Rhododendron vialii]|uniref:uncharacterized protein LOC131322482 isoform X2 n=1 Tax=Rhododendron vialii TaxID=182163 RepID=UPI00265D809D|nr:uncharacterized protein LOC131322482 isoform X2 [Rhododendron vialii]
MKPTVTKSENQRFPVTESEISWAGTKAQIRLLRFRDFRPKNSVMVQGKIPEPSEELRPPLTNMVQGPTDLLGLDPDKVLRNFVVWTGWLIWSRIR